MSPRDWNAGSYDNISAPQQQWGAAVVERLQLRGDETVLDAGAGTGRVTDMVLERLPHGRVIAVDASPSMCETARERLPAERVSVICSDLLELELPEAVDAIVSTATFHWIHDHETLFARLRACLRDGGQFVAQCGGHGNIDRARRVGEALAASEPFAPHLAGMGAVWNYADAEVTRTRLQNAGFEVSACWLQPAPVTPPAPREFLETVIYGPYLDLLPPELHADFIDAAASALGDPLVLEYVRLNWDATAEKT
ncbi:MAG TPA: methyltransferase domain-containing protein [Solirubrobacteraceae bacterium]